MVERLDVILDPILVMELVLYINLKTIDPIIPSSIKKGSVKKFRIEISLH